MEQTISSFSKLVNEWYWMVPCDGTSAHLGTGKHHGWVHWGYTDIKWCQNPGWLPFPGCPELCVISVFGTKIPWMMLRPWLCCWPCLSNGLSPVFQISVPKLISDYSLIITHHFAGCTIRHLVLCWISGSVHRIWYLLGSRWLECCCSLLLLACLEAAPVQWDVILESLTSLFFIKLNSQYLCCAWFS